MAGKSSQNGKMFEMGNIFTKRGKYSPLGKCSPKRENFHIQWNLTNYWENRENLLVQTFRWEYFPPNYRGNTFPQKFSGEYFSQIPRWVFWGNLTSGYLCLQIQEASQMVFPKKRRVRGKRRENIPSFSPKTKIFPLGESFPCWGNISQFEEHILIGEYVSLL